MIDEGHRLKNKSAKLSEALKRIHCPARLLMTGTPLQNNIAELYALLYFICPQEFSSEVSVSAYCRSTSFHGKENECFFAVSCSFSLGFVCVAAGPITAA